MELNTSHVVGAVALAYIVIKEVFVLVKGETKYTARKVDEIHAMLSQMNEGLGDVKEKVAYLYQRNVELEAFITRLNDRLDDLWQWHSKEDDDGVKIWYVRKSLGEAIKKLSEVIAEESRLLGKVLEKLEDIEQSKNTDAS